MMRFLARGNNQQTPEVLRPVVAEFKKLVAQGRSADTLTLHGMMLARDGRDAEALGSFRKAEKLAGDPTEPFEWKADCYLGIGKILSKHGNVQSARQYFWKVAASPPEGLGNALGFFELGRLRAPEDDLDKRYEFLLTASFNGVNEAWPYLSDAETQRMSKAMAEGQDGEAIAELQKWATEWSALAEPIR
jgi:tetratricopeptide (TPR) repeat protein